MFIFLLPALSAARMASVPVWISVIGYSFHPVRVT